MITEYTTLNEPVMGTIIIHDTKEAPAVRLRSLDITPGQFRPCLIRFKLNFNEINAICQ